MNDPLTLALSALAGILLGTLFFGGLWWTVRRGMTSPRPAIWFLSSMIVRMGIAFAGIYYVGKDNWKQMIACVVGFLFARFAVVWLTGQSSRTGKGVGHAP